MKGKKLVTFVLLLFVGVSIIYALVRETGTPSGNGVADSPALQGVTVFYFHGNMRCVSCMTVERLTVNCLTSEFSSEIRDGLLSVEIVNVEIRENEHYVTDFELGTRTVVIRDPLGGWRRLDRVWELTSDSVAFHRYITEETEIELERLR